MARLQRFLSNPSSMRLAAAPCIALCLCISSAQAGKPLVQEEQDMIDTTFGEAPPRSAPSTTTAPLPEQVSTESSPQPDQDTSESTTPPEEEGVFENVVDPGDTYQRNWSLDFQTSLGGSDWDTTTGTVWVGISRSFEAEAASFVPRLGWNRASESPDDLVTHLGIFGASASWMPFMDHTLGLDAEWTTQDGPDDWSASADWMWDRELSDWASLSAGLMGGWSGLSRGFSGASIEATAAPGSWIASVGGSWNRRWQDYLDAIGFWKTKYVNAWGWSTSLHRVSGSWTTGPTWSGEYWKTNSTVDADANATGNTKLAKALLKRTGSSVVSVSASGVEVDQTVSWMVAWKPIESLRVKMDFSRTFGLSDISTRSTNANARKIVSKRTASAVLPPDSWGSTFGVSFDW